MFMYPSFSLLPALLSNAYKKLQKLLSRSLQILLPSISRQSGSHNSYKTSLQVWMFLTSTWCIQRADMSPLSPDEGQGGSHNSQAGQYSFPSLLHSRLQTECPEEVIATQRVWKWEQVEGNERVVPAAPGRASRSPGCALSVPGQHVPGQPVLPARWPRSMDSCSKLSPVNKETLCHLR